LPETNKNQPIYSFCQLSNVAKVDPQPQWMDEIHSPTLKGEDCPAYGL